MSLVFTAFARRMRLSVASFMAGFPVPALCSDGLGRRPLTLRLHSPPPFHLNAARGLFAHHGDRRRSELRDV